MLARKQEIWNTRYTNETNTIYNTATLLLKMATTNLFHLNAIAWALLLELHEGEAYRVDDGQRDRGKQVDVTDIVEHARSHRNRIQCLHCRKYILDLNGIECLHYLILKLEA